MLNGHRAPSGERRYMKTAEVAKLVRRTLKEAFPTVKFSVTSSTYSMGSSINVQWEDGPTTKQVRQLVKIFEGQVLTSDSPGGDSTKTYHDHIHEGEWVHFGVDYISPSRYHSPALIEKARAYFAEHPELVSKLVGGRYGAPEDHDYARAYSDVEPKGSITATRLILENDGNHPAMADRY